MTVRLNIPTLEKASQAPPPSPFHQMSMNSKRCRLVEIMRFSNEYFIGLPGDAEALSLPDEGLWLTPQ